MKTKKLLAYGIMILLVTTITAMAAEAAWYNPADWLGGGKATGVSRVASKISQAFTSKEKADYKAEREQYYRNQGLKDTNTIRTLVEDDMKKWEAEGFARQIETKVGGYIGGALQGVIGVIGGVLEGAIKDTPLERTKNEIVDKIKYKTDLEYKVQSVKTKNELLWDRACDELEKLGQTCERPTKKVTAPITEKKAYTGAKPKSTSKARALMKKYGG